MKDVGLKESYGVAVPDDGFIFVADSDKLEPYPHDLSTFTIPFP